MDSSLNRSTVTKTAGDHLTRDKWLDAAFSAAVKGGFSEIKVLSISQDLGVTRGSFYWHFKSQAELVDALVERWREKQFSTLELIRKAFVDDARTDLLLIFSQAIAFITPNTAELQFGMALRAYARNHPAIAQRINEVDRLRTQIISERFQLAYTDPVQARQRAVIFHLVLSGASNLVTSGMATPDMIAMMQRSVVDQLIQSIPASQT